MEEIKETNEIEETISEEQVQTNTNENGKISKKNFAILNAGVALMFATSALSLGVSCYQIFNKDKDNNNTNVGSHENIGSVNYGQSSVTISEDGYWVINGVKTEVKAEAQNGSDGLNGNDGQDAPSVVDARVVYLDKWNITSCIVFTMSDGTYVTTNTQTQVLSGQYYNASNTTDFIRLVDNLGVEKVRLTGDVTLNRSIDVDTDLDIDLNGKTFSYTASSAMVVEDNCTVSFKDGEVEFKTNKAFVVEGDNAQVKFEEVEIFANATVVEAIGANTNVKLDEVTLKVGAEVANYAVAQAETGSVFVVKGAGTSITIKNSNMISTKALVSATASAEAVEVKVQKSEISSTATLFDLNTAEVVPTLIVDDDTMESSTFANLNTSPITSGNFNFDPTFILEGNYSSFLVNGKWVVAENFADLVAKVEAGSTIVLTNHIVAETAILVNKTLTIDLGGFGISIPEDTAGDGVFMVVEGGNLTINGEGVINGVGNNNYNMALFVNGGHATINGGTYTNVGATSSNGTNDHFDLIYVKGGSVVINGGEFKGQTPAWLLNLRDDMRDSSSIVVNGGVFYGGNPANNAAEGAGTNFVAEGKVIVEKSGVFTVVNAEDAAREIADENTTMVMLNSDIQFETAVEIDHELTIELNGYNISIPEDTAGDGVFMVVKGGNLTINGEGVIDGVGKNNYNMALFVNGGHVTINGGTYTNVGATSSNGTNDHFDLIYVKGGSVVINDGEFKGQTPAWLLNLRDDMRDSSSIAVKGGVFYGGNPTDNAAEGAGTNFVADGYKVVENEGVYTVVEAEGYVYVSTEEEIKTALANTEATTIVLGKNIDFTIAVVVDRTVTLELNNRTLTLKNDTEGYGVFWVKTGGNLTINGEGVINGVGKNNYNMALFVNGGDVTINGGTYTNVGATSSNGTNDHFDLVYVKGGSVVINGGEFKGQTPAWLLNLRDDMRDSSSIAVKGGVFYGGNPADNAAEGAGTNFVADGYKVVENEGVYTVVEAEGYVYVSTEEEIKTALANTEVTTIVLGKNIDFTTAVVVERTVTLELNNRTLTLKNDTEGYGVFWVKTGGNLTINGEGVINGVGKNNYNMALFVNGGHATINGGTYTNVGATSSNGTNDHFDLIYVKGGSVVINGGEFKGQTPAWLLNLRDDMRDSSSIVVNGGVFYGGNPANNAAEGAGTNFVAEGYKVVENEGVYTVVAE